eukprot:CAMPEP_0168756528 /NCGR_PEP_ID=MMETSP0724-20121128/20663_1 /TAXON_ID=265536 /ORGANISM="Amphiprora sp., Strain CCMP467" /LENGTH=832 /DNA_ID=CAMNT_0008805241 /DNA_START=56 /DNA_END=2554 /DNA_ORIENTATION=+
MVALGRTLLLALRASAPTSLHDNGDTDNDTADENRQLRDVEALLAGKPVMDGPLILRPRKTTPVVENDTVSTLSSSSSNDVNAFPISVDDDADDYVEDERPDTPIDQDDDEDWNTIGERYIDNQTLLATDAFNSTICSNMTNASLMERIQARRAAIFGVIRQRSVAFQTKLKTQSSNLVTATSAQFQELFSHNSSSNSTRNLTSFLNTSLGGMVSRTPFVNRKPRLPKSPKCSTFSLFDWTEAFRCCARLAHGQTQEYGKGVRFRNLTMMLTPTLRAKPAPYTFANFGGGEERYETIAQITDLQADFDKGELVMLLPPPPSSAGDNSAPALLMDVPNNSSENSLPPEPTEEVITTASWLMQPEQLDRDGSEGSNFDTMSMARKLKAYLIQMLMDEQEGGKESAFHDKVDYAISLSARVDLEQPETASDGETNARTNPVEKRARLRAYAPSYFAKLRSAYGIDESSYWKSLLDDESPFVSFQSNSKGAQRVGGIFFFTRDGAYMVKTIKPDEVGSFLGKILPKYGAYMMKHGRQSLLCRFCGLYQVKLYATVNGTRTVEKSKAQTFAVMNACFPAQASKSISERFDLKGSSLGRQTSQSEIQSKGSLAILKDMDLAKEVNFVRSSQHFSGGTRRSERNAPPNFLMQKEGLHIGPSAKARLMSQLRKDVELLRECNAIDYSLLVGVAPRQSPMFNYLKSLALATRGTIKFLFPKITTLPTANTRLMFGPSSYWNSIKHATSNEKLGAERHFTYVDMLERCGVDAGPLSRLSGERLGVPAIYYLGLIDFLQPYNAKKSVEYRFKGMKYGMRAGYSCIPPAPYAERFVGFLDRHVT